MSDFDDIDWIAVHKRLVGFAEGLCGGAAATFDCGLSPEDIVDEVWEAFSGSPDALGWKKKKGGLENYFFTVVRNKWIDHLRRTGKVAGSFDDNSFSTKAHRKRQGTDPEANAEYKSFVGKMYELVGADQDLRDLIAATEMIDGGHNVNQQLAEVLDKAPGEVVNLKRRLLNVEGIRELYEQRRQAIRSSRPIPGSIVRQH